MHINVPISPATLSGQYLINCAKIRDVTVSALVNRLISRIGEDQLVLAILDDQSSRDHEKSEHHFREVG